MKKNIILFFCSFILIFHLNIGQAKGKFMVAFNRDGHLWVKINQSEQIIDNRLSPTKPEWSPDGKWLAYSVENKASETYEIRAYNIETKQTETVIQNGYHYHWAPNKNVLAFQSDSVLNVKDFRSESPNSFKNIALGVDNYSWLPNGKGFLASADANLLPDGWTHPLLYKIKLNDNLQTNGFFKNAHRFYKLPKTLKKNNVEILSIGTTLFKWSKDKNWIAFMVEPTASWSMDSDMLCVLSKDKKTFIPLDEMAASFGFDWSPELNTLAYIQGGGRIVSGFKNKKLKVTDFPTVKTQTLTPKGFADLSFTWENNQKIVVSRTPEKEWSNDPKQRPLPKLYLVNLSTENQIKASHPLAGYGDFDPIYLYKPDKLTWIRSNWKDYDIWLSNPDATSPQRWIQNIDNQYSVSWYNPI